MASIGELFMAIFTGFWLLIIAVAKENIAAMINPPGETVSTSPVTISGFKAYNN